MSYKGFKILAVIPARGGSKGIAGKNLRKIAGISLVGQAVKVAQSLDWIDRKIVSTDDEQIAKEGCRYGAEVPFMRPAELAADHAGSADMWKHAWTQSEAHFKEQFDISVLLEPTSPLRRPEDITLTVDTLIESGCAAAATVSRAPAHFTPHKCLTLNEKGIIGFYHKDGRQYSIRQKIPHYYFRNGICYAVKRRTLLENQTIIEQNCKAVIIGRPVVNIDDVHELEVAEFLFMKYYLQTPFENDK
jgi:CMP-N,N'-diacetyllegionaminic acid synthase